MEKSVEQLEEESSKTELMAARKLHAEEICVGDDVAVTEICFQYPSFLWVGIDPVTLPRDQPVRVTFAPFDIEPLTVKSVCLPFVLCESANEKSSLHDIRQVQFAKLDPVFAELARKAVHEKKQDSKGAKRKRKERKRKKKSRK